MRYVVAVTSACTDLDGDVSGEAVRAGLRLAALAWRELGDDDRRWDPFGLDVLAAEELLRGLPEATVVCDPPSVTDPGVSSALARLVGALVDELVGWAGDRSRTLADRPACDAAAGLLRHALAVLP